MAGVRSVGAIVTVVNVAALDLPEDAPPVLDGTVVNFAVRLFAKLDSGMLAIPRPPGIGIALRRDELSLGVLRSRLPHRDGALPPHIRRATWDAVADELRSLGITTDSQSLMELPFEALLVDSEARALLRDDT